MNDSISNGGTPAHSVAWYMLSAQEAAAKLQVDPRQGLSAAEAERRLAQYGPNRLKEQAPRPVWLKLLDQFKSLLILILILAAGVAWVVGDFKDTIVILVVVMFNAILGFYQEHRAEQSLAALKNMLALQARCVAMAASTRLPPTPWCRAMSSCWRPATAFRRTDACSNAINWKSTNPPSPANRMRSPSRSNP